MEVADPSPKNETETSPARQIRRSLDCPRSDPKFVLVVQAFIITGCDLKRSVPKPPVAYFLGFSNPSNDELKKIHHFRKIKQCTRAGTPHDRKLEVSSHPHHRLSCHNCCFANETPPLPSRISPLSSKRKGSVFFS